MVPNEKLPKKKQKQPFRSIQWKPLNFHAQEDHRPPQTFPKDTHRYTIMFINVHSFLRLRLIYSIQMYTVEKETTDGDRTGSSSCKWCNKLLTVGLVGHIGCSADEKTSQAATKESVSNGGRIQSNPPRTQLGHPSGRAESRSQGCDGHNKMPAQRDCQAPRQSDVHTIYFFVIVHYQNHSNPFKTDTKLGGPNVGLRHVNLSMELGWSWQTSLCQLELEADTSSLYTKEALTEAPKQGQGIPSARSLRVKREREREIEPSSFWLVKHSTTTSWKVNNPYLWLSQVAKSLQ